MDILFKPHKISANGNQVKLMLIQNAYLSPTINDRPEYGAVQITVPIPLTEDVILTINGINITLALLTSVNPYVIQLNTDPAEALMDVILGINNNIYITDFYVITEQTEVCCEELVDNTFDEDSITFVVVKKTAGVLSVAASEDYVAIDTKCSGDTGTLTTSGAYAFIELEGSYLNYGNFVRSPILKAEALKYSDFFRWGEVVDNLYEPTCDPEFRFHLFEFRNYCNQFAFQPPPLMQIVDRPYFFTPRTCDYAIKNAKIGYGNISADGVFQRYELIDDFYVMNAQLPMELFSENKQRWGQDQLQVNLGVPSPSINNTDNWDYKLNNPDILSSYYTGNDRRWLTTLLEREYRVGDIDYLHVIMPLRNELGDIAEFKFVIDRTFNDGSTDTVVSVMSFTDVFFQYQEYIQTESKVFPENLYILQIPIHNIWSEFDWTNVRSACFSLVSMQPLSYSDEFLPDVGTGIDGTFDDPTLNTGNGFDPVNNPYLLLGGVYSQQWQYDPFRGAYAFGSGYDDSIGLPANTLNTDSGCIIRNTINPGRYSLGTSLQISAPNKPPQDMCGGDYFYFELFVKVAKYGLGSISDPPNLSNAMFTGDITILLGSNASLIGGSNTVSWSDTDDNIWKKISFYTQGFPKLPNGAYGVFILTQGSFGESDCMVFYDSLYVACASESETILTSKIKANILQDNCKREVIMFQNEFGVPECINMDRVTLKTQEVERTEYYSNNEFLPISLDDRKVRIGDIKKRQSLTFTAESMSANLRNWLRTMYGSPNIYYLEPNQTLEYCGQTMVVPPPDVSGDMYPEQVKHIYGRWIPLTIDGEEFVTTTTNNYEKINLQFYTDPQSYKGRHFKK